MSGSVVDWVSLTDNFDNDKFAISLVIDAFLESVPEAKQKLLEAKDSLDKKKIAMAAHSLKGAMLNFGAPEAVAVAQQLENYGYGEGGGDVEQINANLLKQLDRLVNELQSELTRFKEAG